MALDFSKTQTAKTAKKRMVQAVTANTKDRIIMVPVSKLKESPLNKNMPTDNIEELADSIKENGLQEALLVYEMSDGMFEIYAGHRRYIAMRDVLKWKEVPCISKKYPSDFKVRFKEHFINNSERRENGFRYWLAEVIAARDALLEDGYDGNKRDLVAEINALLDGKVSIAQIYRYEAMEKVAPSYSVLGDLGYSVSMLYSAVSLNAEQQEELARIITEATEKNDGMPVSKKEFEQYVSYVASDKEPAESNDESEKKKNPYAEKLQRIETKIAKGFGKPKTEEDVVIARETISRIRAILDTVEEQIKQSEE